MKEYIKLISETIYDFLIGFWTPFNFLLAIAFIVDDNDGIGIFFTMLTFSVYILLLIPNNIIFFKQSRNLKEKGTLICSFIIGIIISIILYKGKGTINITLIALLIIGNILFLSLNKKSDNIYIILIFILNLIFTCTNINCFNIF